MVVDPKLVTLTNCGEENRCPFSLGCHGNDAMTQLYEVFTLHAVLFVATWLVLEALLLQFLMAIP